MVFRDRTDAGRKLAAALLSYRNQHPIILALPRGGVPVAAEVAKVLRAPLDIVLVRKIGAPVAPELAVGAVVFLRLQNGKWLMMPRATISLWYVTQPKVNQT